MSTTNFGGWLAEKSALVEAALASHFKQKFPCPPLTAAMRDAALGGGKRLRPAMLFAVAGEPHSGQAVEAACALECIHCYSLTHDDLPCMDNADQRRAAPANHIAHGEAMALLSGDCLQSMAFYIAAGADLPSEAVRLLAAAAGAAGMGGGQGLDISDNADTVAKLETMQHLKTGALFACALQLGLLCQAGGGGWAEKLRVYADAFGLMFQITNDLGGKEKDRRDGKATFVTFLGERRAAAAAQQQHARARAALGGDYPRLSQIADFVAQGIP